MIRIFSLLFLFVLGSCGHRLPEISPTLITEKVPHDSDDPAIWVNREAPEKSLVFGTDKDEVNGGIYAFDLDGKIQLEYSITGLSYPNNVDIVYDVRWTDSTLTDLMVFTEREKNQIRIFSIPDLIPVDNGGIPVFSDEKTVDLKRPMGVSFYKNPNTDEIYVIVSRKTGPENGYLYQYSIQPKTLEVEVNLIRKFGKFSGKKEIEAITVDHDLGFIYYSDEGVGIRKYFADPSKGDQEVSLFGGAHFKDDAEGLCIVKRKKGKGYIIASDQGDHSFNIFKRSDNSFVKKLNLGTISTDGCEVTTEYLGKQFPNGLLVTMNEDHNFYFHSLDSLGLD